MCYTSSIAPLRNSLVCSECAVKRERVRVCDDEAAATRATRLPSKSRLNRQRVGEVLLKTSTETQGDMRAAAR